LKPLRHILTGKDMLLYHASEFTREKRKCPAFSATHLVAHRVGCPQENGRGLCDNPQGGRAPPERSTNVQHDDRGDLSDARVLPLEMVDNSIRPLSTFFRLFFFRP